MLCEERAWYHLRIHRHHEFFLEEARCDNWMQGLKGHDR